MSNDKYIKNRKIVYQCSYCGTQYVNVDNCPNCNASTADSKVLADNLDTMLTKDLEEQRTEVVKKSKFTAYMVATVIHMCSCGALMGFLLCPIMLIVHLVYFIVKRKMPHPVVIIDASLSLIMTIVIICVLPTMLD